MKPIFSKLLFIYFFFVNVCFSELTIDVVGGGANKIPITILPFGSEENYEFPVSKIISDDLQRSGLFLLGNIGEGPYATNAREVNYKNWIENDTQHLVVGFLRKKDKNKIEIRFRLINVVKQSQVLGFSFSVKQSQIRAASHRIADLIYEKLTGDQGVFSTRICYVVKKDKIFELHVSDADGFNPQVVHRYKEPIISPQWSPDGRKIAYVSFERKKPIVYILDIFTGKRKMVASFRGSNSAPAWSPDGKKLAVTLTKDGISQIYLINLRNGKIKRLTSSQSIDTEPQFSPDGRAIIFTSDRSGGPQIYKKNLTTNDRAQRLTFNGKYNVTARYSPDAKKLVFVHRNSGKFNIAIQEIKTGAVSILTNGNFDQSPTYSPNGKMILYATEVKGVGELAAVSSDGRVKQKITTNIGDIREPSWGPITTDSK